MMRYYDKSNQRLVYIEKPATNTFWDQHWESSDFEKHIKITQNRFIIKHTQKYLAPGAKVLEGGCGIGQNVYALRAHSYEAYGIDYAQETVKKIQHYAPELNVQTGDVRNLPFQANTFDAYWSLGVIEHFYDGYEPIMREMHRVLKGGGYLFLTVPIISLLRQLKAKLGRYPLYVETEKSRALFYQFAFYPKSVIQTFELHGFRLLECKAYDGIKGLKDEVGFLKPPLQRIYDGKFIAANILQKVVNLLTTGWAGHSALFIFQKVSVKAESDGGQ